MLLTLSLFTVLKLVMNCALVQDLSAQVRSSMSMNCSTMVVDPLSGNGTPADKASELVQTLLSGHSFKVVQVGFAVHSNVANSAASGLLQCSVDWSHTSTVVDEHTRFDPGTCESNKSPCCEHDVSFSQLLLSICVVGGAWFR